MEVILLNDVRSLGKEGETVKVKDGYARNYLIPRKLAMPYAKGAIKIVEEKQKKAALKLEKEKKSAKEIAEKIKKLSLTISTEAGVEDVLFGSVTSEAIARALKQEGIEVDKKNITLDEPIKKLGVYNVKVKLYTDVTETLRIWVVKK